LLIVNFVLLLIGGCGVWYARKTLKNIEEAGKQTGEMLKHAGVQAEAAKLSAEVLINSERAWVVVRAIQMELIPITNGAIRPYNTFRHTLVNKGKTVAKLMEFNAETRLLERDGELPDIPAYEPLPVHGLGFAHGRVLVPEDPINMLSIGLDDRIDTNAFERIQVGDLILYAYGFITYFDFSEKQRKIQFCYRYLPAGPEDYDSNRLYWIVDGPPAYNTHT